MILNNKLLLNGILAFSILSLSIAYFIQYVLGHKPCNLCIIERIPYIAAIILISLIFILNRYQKIISSLILIFFIFGAVVSFYHFGIEQGFFSESLICELSNNKPEPLSNNDKTSEMKQIASDISEFLEKLSASVTANVSTPIRSKTIRRVASEPLSNEDTAHKEANNTVMTEELSDEIVTITEPSDLDNKVDTEGSDEKDESDSFGNDISSIDLAKALIQSDEKEKAREVLLDIIKNGSSSDAHEARLLNLQIS